jgi:hypothetical protein
MSTSNVTGATGATSVNAMRAAVSLTAKTCRDLLGGQATPTSLPAALWIGNEHQFCHMSLPKAGIGC